MLVASRDPFHSGAQNDPLPPQGGGASRFARTMSALQIIGTVLAIPVGIGSAYSMYRANFSVETTCQSLRGNIVAMLDKRVDAPTRHMLVRRDVEAFERSCGSVDPDATAAFKVLLEAEKTAAVAPVRRIETKPDIVAPKAEPRPDVAAKPPVAKPAAIAAAAAPAPHDPASDTVWIDAVRSALAKHAPEPAPAPAEPVRAIAAPMPLAAPALPPAMPVSTAPAPPADDGHPVPPESIPDRVPEPAAKVESRSRLGALAAQIPLVGWVFDR